MSDIDDAIKRADGWISPNNRLTDDEHWQTGTDRGVLANEVKRLRDLVVSQQAAIDQFMARIQHALKELEADDA